MHPILTPPRCPFRRKREIGFQKSQILFHSISELFRKTLGKKNSYERNKHSFCEKSEEKKFLIFSFFLWKSWIFLVGAHAWWRLGGTLAFFRSMSCNFVLHLESIDHTTTSYTKFSSEKWTLVAEVTKHFFIARSRGCYEASAKLADTVDWSKT